LRAGPHLAAEVAPLLHASRRRAREPVHDSFRERDVSPAPRLRDVLHHAAVHVLALELLLRTQRERDAHVHGVPALHGRRGLLRDLEDRAPPAERPDAPLLLARLLLERLLVEAGPLP